MLCQKQRTFLHLKGHIPFWLTFQGPPGAFWVGQEVQQEQCVPILSLYLRLVSPNSRTLYLPSRHKRGTSWVRGHIPARQKALGVQSKICGGWGLRRFQKPVRREVQRAAFPPFPWSCPEVLHSCITHLIWKMLIEWCVCVRVCMLPLAKRKSLQSEIYPVAQRAGLGNLSPRHLVFYAQIGSSCLFF